MICPFCENDFSEVPPGREPSGFYHGEDHTYQTYRRYGYRCGNCGEIVEIIAKPTGNRYVKRRETVDKYLIRNRVRKYGKKDQFTKDIFNQGETDL